MFFSSFIFLKSTLKSASFDTHQAHIVKKFSDPYIVHDQDKRDLSFQGQLIKKPFYPQTFGLVPTPTHSTLDPPKLCGPDYYYCSGAPSFLFSGSG
jgi:hypothetical protein